MINQTKYFLVEIDLSNEETAVVDDWDFTFWPNKPKSEIVKNPNGTFSVIMEENYVPLFNQLNSLFETVENMPEDGTYIGDPILKGKCNPSDIIYCGFINNQKGVIISLKFFEILKTFKIPPFKFYPIHLKKGKKEIENFFYIVFTDSGFGGYDLKFIKNKWKEDFVISENLKASLEESKVSGCIYLDI